MMNGRGGRQTGVTVGKHEGIQRRRWFLYVVGMNEAGNSWRQHNTTLAIRCQRGLGITITNTDITGEDNRIICCRTFGVCIRASGK